MAEQSKNVAGVLAFFLGPLGAHRFYVHRDGAGTVYLLVTFVFLLPVVLGFTGWWDDAFGTDGALDIAQWIGVGGVAVVYLVAWMEAFRFWAMHPRKFARLYTKWVEPTDEGQTRKRPLEEPVDADEAWNDADDR